MHWSRRCDRWDRYCAPSARAQQCRRPKGPNLIAKAEAVMPHDVPFDEKTRYRPKPKMALGQHNRDSAAAQAFSTTVCNKRKIYHKRNGDGPRQTARVLTQGQNDSASTVFGDRKIKGRLYCPLVSALMGLELMKEAYAYAIEKEYRFYSYGDASLLPLAAGWRTTNGKRPTHFGHLLGTVLYA